MRVRENGVKGRCLVGDLGDGDRPLPREEAIRYVEYRLAAYEGSAGAVFYPGALEHLLEHAVGVPRQINVLCHNAMLMAHAARATRVTLHTARECVSALKGPTRKKHALDSSPSKDSDAQSQSDKPRRVASIEPSVSQKLAPAASGMGIGLLIISIVVMSALWLFDMRPQERPRNGSTDA